ncbi:MAG TPA: SDR family NAD(P)-dependent oxidoreductase [Myxococcaceae bacterium]|nr:SDR family NAD(P)-dependent oxidoreductase [Myxococcaceae bacterium]
MSGVQGKVVVITGASSGLGEAAARHLSTEGATVVLGCTACRTHPGPREGAERPR